MPEGECAKCRARTPRMVGALCPPCAGKLARSAQWHVPASLSSQLPENEAHAWLIDPWGLPHAVAHGASVGHLRSCTLVIADAHVSKRHALLTQVDEVWRLQELGSAGGTFIDGEEVRRRAPLEHRSVVQFATIGFYFWAEPTAPPLGVDRDIIERDVVTVEARSLAFRLCDQHRVGAEIVVESDPAYANSLCAGVLELQSEGELVARRRVSSGQFSALRILCEQRIRDQQLPIDDCGWVPTKRLARVLRTSDANVRQKFRELRVTLLDVTSDSNAELVIENERGRGYRVAPRWMVRLRV